MIKIPYAPQKNERNTAKQQIAVFLLLYGSAKNEAGKVYSYARNGSDNDKPSSKVINSQHAVIR